GRWGAGERPKRPGGGLGFFGEILSVGRSVNWGNSPVGAVATEASFGVYGLWGGLVDRAEADLPKAAACSIAAGAPRRARRLLGLAVPCAASASPPSSRSSSACTVSEKASTRQNCAASPSRTLRVAATKCLPLTLPVRSSGEWKSEPSTKACAAMQSKPSSQQKRAKEPKRRTNAA